MMALIRLKRPEKSSRRVLFFILYHLVTIKLTNHSRVGLGPFARSDGSHATLLTRHYNQARGRVRGGKASKMAAFPGLARTKDLHRRSFDEHMSSLEPFPPAVERIARTQTVNSPYFKSQDSGENNPASLGQKANAQGAGIVRTEQALTSRLDSRNVLVSPPQLKRGSNLAASEPTITGGLPSFEVAKVATRSPGMQASHPFVGDARAVSETDLLPASNSKLRRGRSDDNSSNFSGETRLSESTNSRTREPTCCECKFKGHVNLPLIKCSTCTNKFHANEKCINPKFCDV